MACPLRSVFFGMTALWSMGVADLASATVRIDHVGSSNLQSILLGETFTVDVFVTWSGGAGAAGLQGVYTSTSFDSSVVEFVSADWNGVGETAPSVFDGDSSTPSITPGLFRSGGVIQPGDPVQLLRTVSYGSASPASIEGQRRELVTTLTFRLIGYGTTDIGLLLASGDAGTVGGTNPLVAGSRVQVTYLPEPGPALLMGLGLAGLAALPRRDRGLALRGPLGDLGDVARG